MKKKGGLVEINGRCIDDAAVATARERFENSASGYGRDRTKRRASFNYLLWRFSDENLSFGDIATLVGDISEESIRIIYCKYFVDLIPNRKTRRPPEQLRARERGKLRRPEFPGVLAEVAKAAGHAGCRVEAMHAWPNKNGILVNGKKYSVHCSNRIRHSTPKRPRKEAAFHCSTSALFRFDGAIFFLKARSYPRWMFIIPTEDILKAYPLNGDRHSFYVRLQRTKPAKLTSRLRLDFWRYKDKWPK